MVFKSSGVSYITSLFDFDVCALVEFCAQRLVILIVVVTVTATGF